MAEKDGCARIKFKSIVNLYEANKGMPFGKDGLTRVVALTKCNCGYECSLDVEVEDGLITDLKPYEKGECALEKGQE